MTAVTVVVKDESVFVLAYIVILKVEIWSQNKRKANYIDSVA